VAIIDSRAFPEGIGEYKKQLDKLESEFQPRTKDLESIQNNLVKLDDELKAGGGNLDPRVYQQKTETLQSLKKDFERKREDYQAICRSDPSSARSGSRQSSQVPRGLCLQSRDLG